MGLLWTRVILLCLIYRRGHPNVYIWFISRDISGLICCRNWIVGYHGNNFPLIYATILDNLANFTAIKYSLISSRRLFGRHIEEIDDGLLRNI